MKSFKLLWPFYAVTVALAIAASFFREYFFSFNVVQVILALIAMKYVEYVNLKEGPGITWFVILAAAWFSTLWFPFYGAWYWLSYLAVLIVLLLAAPLTEREEAKRQAARRRSNQEQAFSARMQLELRCFIILRWNIDSGLWVMSEKSHSYTWFQFFTNPGLALQFASNAGDTVNLYPVMRGVNQCPAFRGAMQGWYLNQNELEELPHPDPKKWERLKELRQSLKSLNKSKNESEEKICEKIKQELQAMKEQATEALKTAKGFDAIKEASETLEASDWNWRQTEMEASERFHRKNPGWQTSVNEVEAEIEEIETHANQNWLVTYHLLNQNGEKAMERWDKQYPQYADR